MEIVYTNGTDERFNNLCKELDKLLEERMGEEKQNKCSCSNNICGKTNVALLLENGRPIACGALRRYSKSCAEIKRVYVKSEFRKKGYGKLIVSILEKIARRENYHFTLLETGDKLYEAHNMYRNMGYKVIPNYAEYRCMKDSICMKKNIVPKSIETERLILRHIKSSDAEDIFEYSKNPDVGPNAGWAPHKSLEESKELMKVIFLGESNIFGIELKENKKLIGTVGLINDPKRENPKALMLGYALSKDYWKRGIMSEASKVIIDYGFNELDIDMVTCCCYTFNNRSRRVIEKSGFKYEGTIRGAEMRYDGKILDFESFSLIKDEWKKMK